MVENTRHSYRYNGMNNTELGLGRIVREGREIRQLSQFQLAEAAGVGKTVVFDVEHGKPTVQLDTVLKILGALDIRMVLECPSAEKAKTKAKRLSRQPVKEAGTKGEDSLPAHLL